MHSAAPPKVREDKFPDTIPYSFLLELIVTDPEVISELWAKREGRERDEYALGALRLGILALRQPRGQLDAGVTALPHEEEWRLDNVQPALSETRCCASQDIPEGSEEDCLEVEPAAEEFGEPPVANYEAGTVACWYRRRRRRR
jgi:hypothetical protein